MENKKVTQEELEKIQELNVEFNKVKMAIADSELQRQTLIRVVDEIKAKFSAHEQLLIGKYGANAVINIQTGEVTQKTE